VEALRPLVSVLLPIKRWQARSHIALQSLLSQSLQALEIVLIAQPDDPLCKQQAEIDPRIRVINRSGPGIVNALNSGLSVARGQFIARMDDDDFAYPHRLECQIAYLHCHPRIDMCGCQIRFIDTHGQLENIAKGNCAYAHWLNQLTEPEDIKHASFTESPLPHPTLMAHRTVWYALQGYRDIDGPEDYDLLLRALLAGFRMGKPKQILQDWREHDERLTYTDKRYRREAFIQLAAKACTHTSSGLGLDQPRGVWICGTGKRARIWHDALVSHEVTVLGFVDIQAFHPARRKRGLTVIDYAMLSSRRAGALLVLAVSQPSAKQRLAQFCENQGWRNGHDYIFGA